MISKKAQAKIAIAVYDYQEMFPEEYQQLMAAVQDQRDNQKDDLGKTEGEHVLKRALSTISEKLYSMITLKLSESELQEWSSLESQRWFCKEYPQFSLTTV